MEDDFWVRELARLFKRSSEAIRNDDSKSIKVLVNDFNETLSKLKDEYPDNPIIDSTDPIEPTEDKLLMATTNRLTGKSSSSTYEGTRDEALREVRSSCERIANSLEYELPEANPSHSSDQMIIVQMENTQTSQQEVSQSVSIESSVVELIEHDPQAQANQEELRELAEKFNEELKSEDRDEGVLRQYINDAKQYSTSVAAKLSMLALQDGAIDILKL